MKQSALRWQIPAATSGSYPPRPGNLVRPLVDGIPAFRRIGEAIDGARHAVWLTAAFFAPDFCFPDERGSLFDVLDQAVSRGLDVRAIFWRPNPESSGFGRAFPGSPSDRDVLYARGSCFGIRWDRAAGFYCQHQKSWIIDPGQASETAFVGGINLTGAAMGSPGHLGGGRRHDVYVEVSGPAATDVHHNFVQRWNEASERRMPDGLWGREALDLLPFPKRLSERRGASIVQIQRMIAPGRYRNGQPAPGAEQYDILNGERSIFEQYISAIDAARRSIYIENQALPVPEIAVRLERALKRGVEVVVLVPADPEEHVRAARQDPGGGAQFAATEALSAYDNFMLAGIAAPTSDRGRSNVYVHSKIMLVDDVWATIGSCNLHSGSLSGHSEMNVACWDPEVVRGLRNELLSEHLGTDTTELDDRAALQLCRRVAQSNSLQRAIGDGSWQGLAFALAPELYGR